jgi:hypothetical protein
MKVSTSPADVSAYEMSAWIAQLRDEDSDARFSDARPSGGKASDGGPGDGEGTRKIAAPALPAGRPPASASRASRPDTTGRALIGDQLRIPIVWCEIAPCISHHTDPAALGEADNRARALSAGWRFDRLGRLTCPDCQQSSPWFWPAHPVALWDREAAATMAALMAVRDRHNGASRNAEVAHEDLVPPAWPATSARQADGSPGITASSHSPATTFRP